MRIYYGSSDALREKMIRTAGENLQKGAGTLVLVPEMVTLKTEQELLSGLSLPGSFDIQVLSPSRLSERVFDEAGMGDMAGRIRIQDTGKHMAVAGALKNTEKQLKYYGGAVNRQGFIEKMAKLIADLKNALVTPEQVDAFAQSMEDGASKDKMCDIALVYAAYQDYLSSSFADGEDVITCLCDRLEQAEYMPNAHVIAIGFDVITGQFARLLCALEKSNHPVTVLIRCQNVPAYQPVRDSVMRLGKACSELQLECQVLYLPEKESDQAADVKFLKDNFLTSGVMEAPVTSLRYFVGAAP